ncbi:hypothetical protein ACQEVZ_24615 [Dactylosporangium sp. CA-152071]|uniref:hypothetical protein n=1 Tax=Dactylosporangium sp. CA-152071 TaxID=3239933 RepID=UPI003D8DA0D6
MDRTPEPAGPPQWTPGAGLERLKREAPHLIPEVTDEDIRRADEIIAAARRHDEGQQAA